MAKHITRLTSSDYSFNGYRVAITHCKQKFVRYFSDLEHGNATTAYQKAKEVRDAVVQALEKHPDSTESIFARFRKPIPDLPPGIAPLQKPLNRIPSTCTLRCTPSIAHSLKHLCEEFRIDRSSVLKLALYSVTVLFAQKGEQGMRSADLKSFISYLENIRPEDSPDWQHFANIHPPTYSHSKHDKTP